MLRSVRVIGLDLWMLLNSSWVFNVFMTCWSVLLITTFVTCNCYAHVLDSVFCCLLETLHSHHAIIIHSYISPLSLHRTQIFFDFGSAYQVAMQLQSTNQFMYYRVFACQTLRSPPHLCLKCPAIVFTWVSSPTFLTHNRCQISGCTVLGAAGSDATGRGREI